MGKISKLDLLTGFIQHNMCIHVCCVYYIFSFQHAKSWLHTNIHGSLLHEDVGLLHIIVEDTNQNCACVVTASGLSVQPTYLLPHLHEVLY